MKCISILLLFLINCSLIAGSTTARFSRIRIHVPDKPTLDLIWSAGIDYEGAAGRIGGWMEFIAGTQEKKKLQSKGISFIEIVSDIEKKYAESIVPRSTKALGFGNGSMGGHYTFAEVIHQLDSMKYRFPDLITAKDSIGHTFEGRAIWGIKISSNPTFNDPNKPEVLFTALHHAREPMAMMTLIYYMWWLLENYGSDQNAAYLVNNRQQWFIPVVNADGYVYNQTTNPGGGGMWRKNRHGTGIDLNRNYGPMYMWDSPFAPDGSSTDTADETYRGTAPFSEPEIEAIDQFMRSHNIKTCLNYHTYGNYLIYPFGYNSQESDDSLIYRDWTYEMTRENRLQNGTDMETVFYSTRGGSDDYMYGDTTKPVTFSMTPELGTDEYGVGRNGFWPRPEWILPLAVSCLEMNKNLAYYAGYYPAASGYEIQDFGGNGFIDRNENFSLLINIKNAGLGSAKDLNVTVSSSTPAVNFSIPTIIADFPGQTNSQMLFVGNTSSDATTGIPFQVYVDFSNADGFQKRDTLNLYIGTPATVFSDDASDGIGNWTTGEGWKLSTDAHTPPYAFADSSYLVNDEDTLKTDSTIDLSGYQYAQLKFWTKWEIEPTWDFAVIEVSSGNDSLWQNIRTPLSRKGSGNLGSKQESADTWGYDSYTPGSTWVEQEADLSPFVDSRIKLQFRLSSDSYAGKRGFFVDDIRVYGYTTNSTGIENNNSRIPPAFKLDQNYPNPFNPSTTIKFSIADFTAVTLKIYDVLGREIAALINGEKPAGTYSIGWDASALPSGIYFYRLQARHSSTSSGTGGQAGSFTSTRKLVLLK